MAEAGLKLSIAEAKGNFFDRLVIEDKARRARARVLSRQGAYVRQRAITLMLGHRPPKGFGAGSKVSSREGVSAAGDPPIPHRGDLVRWVLFSFDPVQDSVVIGPIKLNKPGAAPEVLEHGGDELIEITRHGQREQVTAHYEPHPYMAPALVAEQGRFPKMWENCIT